MTNAFNKFREIFSARKAQQTDFAAKLDAHDAAKAEIERLKRLHDQQIRMAQAEIERTHADALAATPGVDHLVEQQRAALEEGIAALDALGALPSMPTPTGSSPDELEAYQVALDAVPAAMAEHQRRRLAIADKTLVVLESVEVELKKISAQRSRIGVETPKLIESTPSATLIGSSGWFHGSVPTGVAIVLRSVASGDRMSAPNERDIDNTVTADLLRGLLASVGLEFDDAETIAKAREQRDRAQRSATYHAMQIQRQERQNQKERDASARAPEA